MGIWWEHGGNRQGIMWMGCFLVDFMGFNEATWWSTESTGDIISVRLSWSPINSWGFILSLPIQIYIYISMGGFLLGKYRGEIHHYSACHRLPTICWSNPITYGFNSRCIVVLAFMHQPPAGACLCSAHWLRRFTVTSTQKCPFHTVAAYASTLAPWPREGTALALPMASPVTWVHSWHGHGKAKTNASFAMTRAGRFFAPSMEELKGYASDKHLLYALYPHEITTVLAES